VPIVFTAVSDPVKMGLVASLNHPGGNVTGIAALTRELDPKRLELLREILPSAATLGALVNPNRRTSTPNSPTFRKRRGAWALISWSFAQARSAS
jgi:putative ABC transport system substrate-binding protein